MKGGLLCNLALLGLLLNTWQHADAAVGTITEQTAAVPSIQRSKSTLQGTKGTGVEMQDEIKTQAGKAGIKFADDTQVKINENSKLVIDEFVYDPKAKGGKLGVKVALGTVRYASGQIAKNNPQNVAVNTPTATIAVRGTDFTMTVDEVGASTIILLPSCPKNWVDIERDCKTGRIEVITDAGSVFMDAPYQTTVVASRSMPPSKPVIISIDPANINNLLIVSPPKELRDDDKEKNQQKTALDVNFLNQDFLKYNALDKDELKAFKALDVNFLDVDFLVNMLDASTAALMASQDVLAQQSSLLPGYNEASGLKYYFNDDGSKITLYKITTNTAYVTLNKEGDAMVNITQDSIPLTQKVNKGGTTNINIIQR